MSRIESLAPYVRAASVGAAAGLRSLSPPAIIFREKASWVVVFQALAAGELLADKFPQAPSRLFAPALILRTITGAICGGEIAIRGKASRIGGIISGSAAAIAASYSGYALRKYLTETRMWHGFTVAAAEDAITLLLVRFAEGGNSA